MALRTLPGTQFGPVNPNMPLPDFGFSLPNIPSPLDWADIVMTGALSIAVAPDLVPNKLEQLVTTIEFGMLVTPQGLTIPEITVVSSIKEVYDSPRHAPKYPEGFIGAPNGRTVRPMNNKQLEAELRQVDPGKWNKVYHDGWARNGRKVSVHYFQGPSGKAFDVKAKPGWSGK
ncbi:hypothetical protein [Kiloniella laminariae]|uniref:hypothetical protein n=1 Tax=Kiloniella laminariae TaxID=454162 RepID=UPI0012F8261E|nr:hypothetical protein [Kiloniella laminariae]